MQVFLIRHPQPDVAHGLCYGQTDLALTDTAKNQLSSMAQQLRLKIPADAPLYSSPLQRCRARASALHSQPQYDARLQEMNFGEWEMQAWSSIPRQQLDDWAADPLNYQPPSGESVAQLQQRVLEFMAEKKQMHQQMILVTHAGVMKILCGVQHKLPLQQWMALSFDYGALEILDWSGT